MILIVDNYDSFVYNLATYAEELGAQVEVVRAGSTNAREIQDLHANGGLEGIIFSPGPGHPKNSTTCLEILGTMQGRVPILGVCLGHQIIAHYYGASVVKGKQPRHGKISALTHNSTALFYSIPSPFQATRYHSLVVAPSNVPDTLVVDSYSDDGAIMALHHREHPVFGVQFHPEAVCSEHGHVLLKNFLDMCRQVAHG